MGCCFGGGGAKKGDGDGDAGTPLVEKGGERKRDKLKQAWRDRPRPTKKGLRVKTSSKKPEREKGDKSKWEFNETKQGGALATTFANKKEFKDRAEAEAALRKEPHKWGCAVFVREGFVGKPYCLPREDFIKVDRPKNSFDIIEAKYKALPDGPLQKDKYSDSVLLGYQGLARNMKRPGRGEGLYDWPGLKVVGDINPSDVSQGQCGNCWMLSAISALAEFPGALEKLFKDGKRTKLGGPYTLQLYDIPSQKTVDVTVDERLYVDRDGRALYSKASDDGELWCPIIEKALAAHCRGWDKICGGTPTLAWVLMTGTEKVYQFRQESQGWMCMQANFRKYRGNSPRDGDGMLSQVPYPDRPSGTGTEMLDDESFWEEMCAWDDKNYVIACGSKPGSDSRTTQGIVDGHAYTVIICCNDVGKIKVDMLLVRNPHGKTEFTGGRWQEGSSAWKQNPDVKSELDKTVKRTLGVVMEDSDDGLFWMEKKDFQRFFKSVSLLAKSMC